MWDVVTAYQGRAWIALDYPSWADYIKGEFEYAPLAVLPREERRAVVALLHGQGMSKRAIAPAVGVDRQTVANDLDHVGGENSPPDGLVTGQDGKQHPTEKPRPAAPKPSNTFANRFYRALSQLQEHARLTIICTQSVSKLNCAQNGRKWAIKPF
jgi:transposase-like protein